MSSIVIHGACSLMPIAAVKYQFRDNLFMLAGMKYVVIFSLKFENGFV